jgi:hypothetical protein
MGSLLSSPHFCVSDLLEDFSRADDDFTLVALMKNQVDALRGYGVKVHLLSSESTMEERQDVSELPMRSPLLSDRVLLVP